MYILASQLRDLPIMSLQTGENIAAVKNIIMDGGSLELIAMSCEVDHKQMIMTMSDIRELALDCVIIDSEDELVEAEDVVRVKALMAESFQLIGMTVDTDLNRRIGSVEDYTINLTTHRLQKLYVRRSLLKSFLGSSLIIDRHQIVDVMPKTIIVRDTVITEGVTFQKPAPGPSA